MNKSLIIIVIMLTVVFSIPLLGYGQANQTEFTKQNRRGVAFAESDAKQAIKEGKIYIISGGEGNEPLVNEADLGTIEGIPSKSIGCTGDFKYAKKFNEIVIQYLKQNKALSEDLSREGVLRIATDKAKELGYKLEEMNVTYDDGNKKIKEHLTRSGISTYNKKTKTWEKNLPTTPEKEYPELAGRNYQAVYCAPKKMQLGGDLWVFIDKDTGEVIRYIRGK